MADQMFAAALERMADGTFTDWASGDYRLLLLDDAGSYTLNSGDELVADLTPASNELADALTGYERKTLANLTITEVSGVIELTCDDVIFSSLAAGESPAIVVQAAVVYEHVTDDSDSLLVAYLDSISGTTDGSNVTVQLEIKVGA